MVKKNILLFSLIIFISLIGAYLSSGHNTSYLKKNKKVENTIRYLHKKGEIKEGFSNEENR
jgi:hypothetical protein